MNGKTNIDAILNPCSAEMDRKTYGWSSLNICIGGKRIIRFRIGRLTMDVYKGGRHIFTSMGGGANGTARYWNLFWPLGSITWITRKPKGNI